ncbi:MAG: hypothetical protein JF886_03025 [Candidatus Dormibacteraeota bacterium]|uniref:Uncharacterized protein n=1 Tax=Candidatus Aeolococcus gillhamiae TaxID=3127015 RepID=A0A2W6A185_9BACT|nr:hypothetical protein [Candidatus Dormibacteraeota bacterium]PZR77474.1 MAG: hypothetical protein DLM65_15565 [Candidatus Dormibacter sp. RRmetagenome_bin12]
MHDFEITELGQIREQESMLARLEARARRQARREARGNNGPVVNAPWLVAFLGMGEQREAAAHHCHPHTAHDAGHS